ncbi:hypothetical protein PFISCL1PPCAC_26391, partial [Pristionchus fissidentatus]
RFCLKPRRGESDGASRRVWMTQATERQCSQPSSTRTTERTSRRRTASTCRSPARTSSRRRPIRPRSGSATSRQLRVITWRKLATNPASERRHARRNHSFDR